jgi:2-polyprenyl-3-methyl-5-hydroxy-6-metoxy-1,4-benzoquinol methylase
LEKVRSTVSSLDERVAVNQARWEEMAVLHQDTYFAPGAGVTDSELKPFERAELGDLTNQHVCHLQCHLGGDSLSLARLGATVVGVDFSANAVEFATKRAAAASSDKVQFVQATVEAAPAVVGSSFDGVYTSWGVLCWLPNLQRWADAVAALLRSGGWLYLAETHPYATAARSRDYPYGGAVALFNDEHGDYTDADATFEHPQSWEWTHGLGEIISAVAAAGLRIDFVHEHPTAAWNLNDPAVQPVGDGLWELPGSTLPLSFTLRAEK